MSMTINKIVLAQGHGHLFSYEPPFLLCYSARVDFWLTTVWPIKLRIFITLTFTEDFCQPLT